jgi:hypothetical protein
LFGKVCRELHFDPIILLYFSITLTSTAGKNVDNTFHQQCYPKNLNHTYPAKYHGFLGAESFSRFFPNITKSALEDKKLKTSCHDRKFGKLMIFQVSSKIIDRPGSKILHCNQDWNGYATEKRLF